MAVTIMEDLLDGLELSETVQKRALAKAREGYVMALLEVGEITSGRAGKILGVPRLEVLEMMKRWGISLFDDSQTLEDLALEVDQAERVLNQGLIYPVFQIGSMSKF
jgi:predicted HTH domain antitoxin